MSEIKFAFAERTIQSLKNILYRYLEDNGYKNNQNLTQFVTTLYAKIISSMDLIPKNVRNSDFLTILYGKPLREFRKRKFKNGVKVRMSKYDLFLGKGYKPQFTQEVFEFVVFSSRELPTDTIKDEKDEIIRGKFYQKEMIKVI